MLLSDDPAIHLTYCLNAHRGESWEDNFSAIKNHARRVRDGIAADREYGLGLRISNQAARSLAEPATLEIFRDFLRSENLYAFTINGFPYGRFHDVPVKEGVYRPDWRSEDRSRYTVRLAELLAEILPAGCPGTISTVPCSFKPWIVSKEDRECMVRNLVDCTHRIWLLSQERGVDLSLGLEPEPCCYLESTDDFLRFYEEELLLRGLPLLEASAKMGAGAAESMLRKHLGLCLDTCHLALQFEDLVRSTRRVLDAGIRITKVQISAALEVVNRSPQREALGPFDEPVYLHQVKRENPGGSPDSWTDLPDALRALRGQEDDRRIRVHFHVPLFWEGDGPLGTTAANLTPEFFSLLGRGDCPHLEIETYTFDVLPASLKACDVVESIVKEHQWVLDRFRR